MAVARSIFILDGGFHLFLAAFDLLVTVVPLKMALGLEKFDFWVFREKMIMMSHLTLTCVIWAFWTNKE